MPDRELPPRPSLEQYKKQAKDLVKGRAEAAPEALERIQRHHPRWRDLPDPEVSFKLSDAQLVVAREHDFESWSKFARRVQELQPVQSAKFSARIPVDGVEFAAEIVLPANARGLVLLAHASGSGRFNPRNRRVQEVLNGGALGTVLADLFTEEEELADIETEELLFNIRLLGHRTLAITDWLSQQPSLKNLPLGYFGSGTGAAAALFAAAERPSVVRALISSGGRPDLAGPWIWKVHAPALFIVGDQDTAALAFNHSAIEWFPSENVRRLEVIAGVRHPVEKESALEKSACLARDWFGRYLAQ